MVFNKKLCTKNFQIQVATIHYWNAYVAIVKRNSDLDTKSLFIEVTYYKNIGVFPKWESP